MKLAIMQPYFLPYMGYFQLIDSVDNFIVYDDIQYTKKGWINRNRMLVNDKADYFSLSVKKSSSKALIEQKELSDDYDPKAMLRKINSAYMKAPYFSQVFPLFERIFLEEEKNLFRYIFNSIRMICDYLAITTTITPSSKIGEHQSFKGQDKVLRLCTLTGARHYINAIGGRSLYEQECFNKHNIELSFIKANAINYQQFSSSFEPWLSILDVLMFNSKKEVQFMLKNEYQLVR